MLIRVVFHRVPNDREWTCSQAGTVTKRNVVTWHSQFVREIIGNDGTVSVAQVLYENIVLTRTQVFTLSSSHRATKVLLRYVQSRATFMSSSGLLMDRHGKGSTTRPSNLEVFISVDCSRHYTEDGMLALSVPQFGSREREKQTSCS